MKTKEEWLKWYWENCIDVNNIINTLLDLENWANTQQEKYQQAMEAIVGCAKDTLWIVALEEVAEAAKKHLDDTNYCSHGIKEALEKLTKFKEKV